MSLTIIVTNYQNMMPKEFEYDGEFKSQGYAYSETYEIQVTLQQTPTNSKLRTGKGNRK